MYLLGQGADYRAIHGHGQVGGRSRYGKTLKNVSVLYPPIQEEVTIRKNIARGPQYNTDIKYYPANFQACHKSEYCPGPSVTGPSRKRCLNTDLGYVPWAMRVWPPI